VTEIADLGQDFGGTLYAREIDYLKKHEWALSIEDILERRTHLGLS
jgi:glycerol-3-phosphate dehydrogenase